MLGETLVVDLADEQGSFCSKLLADLGASVIKVEPPDGDPERVCRPYTYYYHQLKKHSLSIDLRSENGRQEFLNLFGKADVLVETFRPGALESLGIGLPLLRRLNPRLIHLSITPFGQEGPRSGHFSSDAVVSAVGGQMYLSGAPGEPPREVFAGQSYYTASLFGAVAILIQLRKRKITGKGGYIDLSIQETVLSTLGNAVVDYFQTGKIAKRGEPDRAEGFTAVPCSDGYILMNINRSWETLLELMVSEGKAGDLPGKEWKEELHREEHFDLLVAAVGQWTRCHTKQELFELGQAMHFPWAPVSLDEDVFASPQLKARNFFIQSKEAPALIFPGSPYQIEVSNPGSEPEVEELKSQRLTTKDRAIRDEEILTGIRVLDLTRILSGPYATRILADFGAEVVKVQSEKTAKGAEQNDTPSFAAWNRNKRSITLDLDLPEARSAFLRLAADSDIVVENFSPRVMANWGLDYERLREINPDIVVMSISAMGHTGPWRDFVGLAPTFHALSGLLAANPRNLNPPAGIGNPYADVVTGLYAALAMLSALDFRDRTGRGQHIDLSAYEAMCALTMGSRFEIRDSRFPRSGVYGCAGDDRWCVISIESDEQGQTLCRLIGIPELNDELVSRWTAGRTPESIVRLLQDSGIGIAAGVVRNVEDLAKDPQLSKRRFFVSLDHPVLGKVISDRSPIWDWRRKPKGWKSSPMLGEHNSLYFE